MQMSMELELFMEKLCIWMSIDAAESGNGHLLACVLMRNFSFLLVFFLCLWEVVNWQILTCDHDATQAAARKKCCQSAKGSFQNLPSAFWIDCVSVGDVRNSVEH